MFQEGMAVRGLDAFHKQEYILPRFDTIRAFGDHGSQ